MKPHAVASANGFVVTEVVDVPCTVTDGVDLRFEAQNLDALSMQTRG